MPHDRSLLREHIPLELASQVGIFHLAIKDQGVPVQRVFAQVLILTDPIKTYDAVRDLSH